MNDEYKYSKSLQSGGKRSALMGLSMALAVKTLGWLPFLVPLFEARGMGPSAQIIAVSGVWVFIVSTFLNWLKRKAGIDFWGIIGNFLTFK